jgi:hypothetical protein
MNRCLRDKTLLLLRDGEGNSRQRTHLKDCEACAARYKAMGQDLQAISAVLRQEPPMMIKNHRFRPLSAGWLPATVAAVFAVALAWQGVRLWNPPSPPTMKGITAREAGTLLEDLSGDAFLLGEAVTERLWTGTADSYYLAAALDGERPCEWYDALETREAFDASLTDLPAVRLSACVELDRG